MHIDPSIVKSHSVHDEWPLIFVISLKGMNIVVKTYKRLCAVDKSTDKFSLGINSIKMKKIYTSLFLVEM